MLVGIVGKPSSGKSTFFKASTLAEVEIASYPFTTIKPNRGAAYVRVSCVDRELNVKCNPREGFCISGNRFVPVEFLDVAGLVPGAHQGKGLGNQFLDDLRQANALVHVVDASGSTDENGKPVDAGSHNPSDDVRFLETELDLWYLAILKKPWEKFAKQTYMERHKVEDAIADQFSGLNANTEIVKSIIAGLGLNPENPLKWSERDLQNFAVELRRATKQIIIAANKADLDTAAANIKKMQEEFKGHMIVPCSAESELALREAARENLIEYIPGDSSFTIKEGGKLSPKQRKALEFIDENVLKKHGNTGVQDCLNKAVFDLLKCVAVFPGGVNKLADQHGRVLPDCILMPENSTAVDFAFRLHTDLGEGFIRAIDVRTRKTVGRDYALKNRDVVEIISRK
ncbi:redox-regulated ATPase YchF [Candidatus Woesearchaeota archaeon]|nr:redox-regulated ATPase YchF [Candidatus Woesearchaeota archaeon]